MLFVSSRLFYEDHQVFNRPKRQNVCVIGRPKLWDVWDWNYESTLSGGLLSSVKSRLPLSYFPLSKSLSCTSHHIKFIGIGFDMWHVVVSKWNRGKTLEIKCFPDKAKFDGVQNIYEVHGIYDIPLKTNNGLVTLGKIKETTIYKCVARDTKERVVSTQLYIVTITGLCFFFSHF